MNTFKHISTLLLLLLAALPLSLRAESASGSGWTLSDEGCLTIQSDAAWNDYDERIESDRIRKYARYASQVRSIIIAEGLYDIPSDAFGIRSYRDPATGAYTEVEYFHVSNVSIPASVCTIGFNAFRAMHNDEGYLTFTFAEGSNLLRLEDGCFGNTSIRSIQLPESLREIGSYCFDGCDRLESIVIPARVESIDRRAFVHCFQLSSITFRSQQAPELGDEALLTGGDEHGTTLAIRVPGHAGSYYVGNWTAYADKIQSEHRYLNGICQASECSQRYMAPAQAADGYYEIANAGNLYWFAGLVNGTLTDAAQNATANARLTGDVDMEGRSDWMPIGLENMVRLGFGNTPEAAADKGFLGTFDGQGHTIRNLTVPQVAYTAIDENLTNCLTFGLFGAVSGTVTQLNVQNITIGAKEGTDASRAGALVGAVYPGGSVSYCSATDCQITSAAVSGALAGANYGGSVTHSWASAVQQNSCERTGGLVSDNKSDEGALNGTISFCASDGTLCNAGYSGTVENSLSSQTADDFRSGVVTWLLNGNGASNYWRQNLGNASPDPLPVSNTSHPQVYYGLNGNGIMAYANEPLYDTPAAPYNAFFGCYDISCPMHLKWFAGLVNGTLEGVERNAAANARLMCDVDMSAVTDWMAIGDASGYDLIRGNSSYEPGYTGLFNGLGHEVRNLQLQTPEVASGGTISGGERGVGLFGIVSGTVRNLGVSDVSFATEHGNWHRYGALAGMVSPIGKIESCYAKNVNVQIPNSAVVGGFVAGNYGGTISHCFSYNTQLAGSRKGDFICDSSDDNRILHGTMEYCVSPGSIKGPENQSYNPTVGCLEYASADDYKSGRVAYLLNEEGKLYNFRQNLMGGSFTEETADAVPVLASSHLIVYYGESVTEEGSYVYTNTQTDVRHTHAYDAKGFCQISDPRCSGYQPATPVVENETTVYEIGNAGQLYWFAALLNIGSIDGVSAPEQAHARLTADIVVNEGDYTTWDLRLARQWTPMNNDYRTLYNFDGQGHSVSGLCCTQGDNAAFIRHVNYVQDLVLKNSVFNGNYIAYGLAGVAGGLRDCRVEHCQIKSPGAANALANTVNYYLQRCTVTDCEVIGGRMAAGLAYRINASSQCITDCSVVASTIASEGDVASGLVNTFMQSSEIDPSFPLVSNCLVAADIQSASDYNAHDVYAGWDGETSDDICSNCYTLEGSLHTDGSGEAQFKGTVKTAEEMASGHVAVALNAGRSELVWGQRFGTDALPSLATEDNRIYQADVCRNGVKLQTAYFNRGGKVLGLDLPNAYILCDAAIAPEGQNVVTFDGSEYRCLDLHIYNSSAFATPFPFTAEEATFHIETPEGYVWADGTRGWHTLCVPFDGKLYLGDEAKQSIPGKQEKGHFWLKELCGFDAASQTLLFDYASEITAGTPYIVAFPGATAFPDDAFEGQGEITVRGHRASFPAVAKTTDTFDRYFFAGSIKGKAGLSPDNEGARYVLNEEGTQFVQSYSAIQPFTAYIYSDFLNISSKALKMGDWEDYAETTGLTPVNGTELDAAAVYDLSGRRIAPSQRPLLRGIYVVNGQKVVVK